MQIYVFNNRSIKIQNSDGQIWFCGADVARAIGYKNPAEAIADNVSPKHSRALDLGKKGRKPIFISEAGLFELIMRSTLPTAYSVDCRQAILRQETSNALLAKGSGGWSLDQVSPIVLEQNLGWEIRRLTPIECERLQGFPDNYTNIPWRDKPYSPNSLRYKALGNSMAVPCLTYIADCLDMVLQRY